jgi:hypothetical protein
MAPGTSTTTEEGDVTYEAGEDLAVNEISGSNVNLGAPDGMIEDVNKGAVNIFATNIVVDTQTGTGTQADENDTANDTGFLDNLIGETVPNKILFNNRIMGGAVISSLDTVQASLSSMSDWIDIGGLGLTVNTVGSLVLGGVVLDPVLFYRHDQELDKWYIDLKSKQRQESSGVTPEDKTPSVSPEIEKIELEKPGKAEEAYIDVPADTPETYSLMDEDRNIFMKETIEAIREKMEKRQETSVQIPKKVEPQQIPDIVSPEENIEPEQPTLKEKIKSIWRGVKQRL